MKRVDLNHNKGITLITLVITVIVLAILAGVTVTALTSEKNVINEANDAASLAEQQSAKEKVQAAVLGAVKKDGSVDVEILEKKLGVTIGELPEIVTINGIKITVSEDGNVGGWITTEQGITDGTTILQIGDSVNYNELANGTKTTTIDYTKNGGASSADSQTLTTENLGWRVLGANSSGQLELISDNSTTATLYLAGEKGYLNGVQILNDTCDKLYGKGTGAVGARSLNDKDINSLNYDKWMETQESMRIYKYRYPQGGSGIQVCYLADNGTTWTEWKYGESNSKVFRLPGSTSIININNAKESKEIKSNAYAYMIEDEEILDLLKYNGDGQWVAHSTVSGGDNKDYLDFGIGYIYSRGQNSQCPLYKSNESEIRASFSIRPVVTLNSNIQLTGNSTEGWSISQ